MAVDFELIFEGQNDPSKLTKNRIVKVLSERYGYNRSLAIEDLIDSGPFLITRSKERAELEVVSSELRKVGARVLIVEQTREVPTISPKTSPRGFPAFFERYVERLHSTMKALNTGEIERLAHRLMDARGDNRQIFIFGNGGSAALASHFATDLAKERFADERSLFRVQSLNDNSALLSATANDFGYEKVFVSQLKNLLQPRDLVIAISSSGNSPNILEAIKFARHRGAETWGIVGFDGGALLGEATEAIYISTKKGQYGFMEDAVSILVHIISIYIYEHDQKIFT
ncbi:MAG: SIS domain-containing protein [Proteobacteria bacterium]|nr:SIS domain-containing protein [Pseudomonadota bacterium]